MRSIYERACSYAWKCNPWLYKDLVHQAYLSNYKHDGTNLFEKNIYFVIRCIRNVHFNEIDKHKWSFQGELVYKEYVTNEFLLSPYSPPDGELITKEFYEELFKRVDNYHSGYRLSSTDPKKLRMFLELYNQGYSLGEISKEMGILKQTASNYKQKIKAIIRQMQITNPFAGHKTTISKKVTRKTFDEKYKDEYEYNVDKGSDFNEYYMIYIHKETGEALLVKEPEKDYKF